MKTDYTLTPEYEEAQRLILLYRMSAGLQNSVGRESPEYLVWLGNALRPHTEPMTAEQLDGMRCVNPWRTTSAKDWEQAYEDARKSHAAGEPLIRTVCKIAARILFVLLLIGIGVGVMLK